MNQQYDPSIAGVRNTAVVKGLDCGKINFVVFWEFNRVSSPGLSCPSSLLIEFLLEISISPRVALFRLAYVPGYTKHFLEICGHRRHSWSSFKFLASTRDLPRLVLWYMHYINYHSYFGVNNSAPTLQNKSTHLFWCISMVYFT